MVVLRPKLIWDHKLTFQLLPSWKRFLEVLIVMLPRNNNYFSIYILRGSQNLKKKHIKVERNNTLLFHFLNLDLSNEKRKQTNLPIHEIEGCLPGFLVDIDWKLLICKLATEGRKHHLSIFSNIVEV